jgi:hypothetical protein
MKWTIEKEELLKTSMDRYTEQNKGQNISWADVHDIWIQNQGDIKASPKRLKSKWQFISKFDKAKYGSEIGRCDNIT